MKKPIKPTKTYPIEVTEEQIKLIRTLWQRADMLYIRRGVEPVVTINGAVKHQPFFECWFCGQAAYEKVSDINHLPKCLLPLLEREMPGLAEQFQKVDEQIRMEKEAEKYKALSLKMDKPRERSTPEKPSWDLPSFVKE